MDMMKLLIINDKIRGGGPEKVMYELIHAWHNKYDITVMTEKYFEEFYDIYPVKVKYISLSKYCHQNENFMSKICNVDKNEWKEKFITAISDENYDVALFMKEGQLVRDYYGIHACLKFGWVHTDYGSHYYTYSIFGGPDEERNVMCTFQGIICVSQDVADALKNVIGDPGNLLVRYSPININKIRKQAGEPVVDMKIADNKMRFISIGRYHFQKGYDLLLEACHMLECEGYLFEVWIIGEEGKWEGEYFRLMNTMRRLHIDSVKFIGARKNPYKYLHYANWYLSTSISEGCSIACQEAMALGKPLLLTECSGVSEMFCNYDGGIIIEPSVLGIYQGMKQVMDHPELEESFARTAAMLGNNLHYAERIQAIEDLFC